MLVRMLVLMLMLVLVLVLVLVLDALPTAATCVFLRVFA